MSAKSNKNRMKKIFLFLVLVLFALGIYWLTPAPPSDDEGARTVYNILLVGGLLLLITGVWIDYYRGQIRRWQLISKKFKKEGDHQKKLLEVTQNTFNRAFFPELSWPFAVACKLLNLVINIAGINKIKVVRRAPNSTTEYPVALRQVIQQLADATNKAAEHRRESLHSLVKLAYGVINILLEHGQTTAEYRGQIIKLLEELAKAIERERLAVRCQVVKSGETFNPEIHQNLAGGSSGNVKEVYNFYWYISQDLRNLAEVSL